MTDVNEQVRKHTLGKLVINSLVDIYQKEKKALEIAKKIASVFIEYAHDINYKRVSLTTQDVFATALLQACHNVVIFASSC